mgnify:CR=1 FL=1
MMNLKYSDNKSIQNALFEGILKEGTTIYEDSTSEWGTENIRWERFLRRKDASRKWTHRRVDAHSEK